MINVEYNQLGPLLSSQGDRGGDVPDPKTGYSPYPGNANIIVVELGSYARTLGGEDAGVVDEFVNPKYKDGPDRSEFKKPTRLECMMQDLPKLFRKEMGGEARIGFTVFERWFTFSPAKVSASCAFARARARVRVSVRVFGGRAIGSIVGMRASGPSLRPVVSLPPPPPAVARSRNAPASSQNSLATGVEDVRGGGRAPGTMSSAESDKYVQNQRKLRHAGADIRVTPDDGLVPVAGIPVTPGPRVILCPAFAVTQREVLEKIGGGCRVSDRSSLVLEGEGLRLTNLDLDGALVIRTGPDCDVTVDGLVVRNGGCEIVEVGDGEDVPEEVAIRGYTMRKHEVMEIIISEPGRYRIGPDGVVERLAE